MMIGMSAPASKKQRREGGGGGVEESKRSSRGGGGGRGKGGGSSGGVHDFLDEHDVPSGPELRQADWQDEDEADAGYVFNDDGAADDDDEADDDDKQSSRRMIKKFDWEVDKVEEEVSLISAPFPNEGPTS